MLLGGRPGHCAEVLQSATDDKTKYQAVDMLNHPRAGALHRQCQAYQAEVLMRDNLVLKLQEVLAPGSSAVFDKPAQELVCKLQTHAKDLEKSANLMLCATCSRTSPPVQAI